MALIFTQTINQSGTVTPINSNAVNLYGRRGGANLPRFRFVAQKNGTAGTFGGGTVGIQTSDDNGTVWLSLPDASGTAVTFANADGQINAELFLRNNPGSYPSKARFTLTGATNPNVTLMVFNED